METFKVRSVKPKISRWFDVSANSYSEAIQSIHAQFVPTFSSGENVISSIVYNNELGDDRKENVYFSLIEAEGHGEFVSRIYYRGIRRVGKFNVNKITLEHIANVMGWKHDLNDLLNDNWEIEESFYKDVSGNIYDKPY